MFSQIAIIFNPNSTGPSEAMARQLADQLAEAGLKQVEPVATTHAGHAEELAYKIATSSERALIISSSGDGGYNEVVNGVMRAQAEGHAAVCAVLPAGNANDHRRTLARRPLHEAILAGTTTRIDLLTLTVTPPGGPATTRYAHSYMGLGLTPVIATELNRHSLTAWRELVIAVKAFRNLKPFTIEVEGRRRRYDSLIFSNINSMAKALSMAKDAKPNDGMLRVTYFKAGGKLTLLWQLFKAATIGLHSNRRTRDYRFETTATMPMQLDGEVTELAAGSKVQVGIAPRRLETVL